MLAAFCFNQAVDGVIDIVVVGGHHLVVEVDRLLGAVLNSRAVASGIVGLVQVL